MCSNQVRQTKAGQITILPCSRAATIAKAREAVLKCCGSVGTIVQESKKIFVKLQPTWQVGGHVRSLFLISANNVIARALCNGAGWSTVKNLPYI